MLVGGIALAGEQERDVTHSPVAKRASEAVEDASKEAGAKEEDRPDPKIDKARLPAEKATDPKTIEGYDPGGGAGKKIYIMPIEGTIDLGLAPFVERVVQDASKNDVILLRMKTFGGRVDGAVRMRDALLDAEATTVVYIDHRAISAGALISLACDTIIMSPGASIGAATPVQAGGGGEMKPTSEKVVSYMRAEMRSTAEAKGRRGDLAEAMVDSDVEIEDVTPKGKLLTLTGNEALRLELADATAATFEDAISLLNLEQATRVEADTDWAEKLARILTDPIISSLLMTFGVLGLLMEFYTPGFGVGGIVGLACLGLFFLGQFAAHLAGWEELIIFVVGVVLLGVEVFVIPGFGFVGIAGILCVAVSMVMALVELDLPWDVSWDLGYVQEAMWEAAVRLSLLAIVATVATVVFAKYFPKTSIGRRIILGTATATADGYVGQAKEESDLLGRVGFAEADLRPAGIGDFGGKRVDVVSRGGYVEAGSKIEVIQVDGNRVVVKKV
jgi:membrane-bound serine protease (ClpP class)